MPGLVPGIYGLGMRQTRVVDGWVNPGHESLINCRYLSERRAATIKGKFNH